MLFPFHVYLVTFFVGISVVLLLGTVFFVISQFDLCVLGSCALSPEPALTVLC